MKRAISIFMAGFLTVGIAICRAQTPATQSTQTNRPARAQSSQSALQQRLSEFRVDGIPFAEVIAMLAQLSGANFSVRWNQLELAGIDRQTPVSVSLNNITLAKALNVVLESVETADVTLGYYVHENVITITLSHTRRTNLITRVYDVTDMMFRIPDIDPSGNGGGSSNQGIGRSSQTGR